MKRMYDKLRMGAVGEEDVILALRAVGAVTAKAVTPYEVQSAIHRLHRQGIPLIFITERAARMAPEVMERYEQSPDLALIPIPGVHGTDGFGAQRVRDRVIKAIGADILSNNGNEEQ